MKRQLKGLDILSKLLVVLLVLSMVVVLPFQLLPSQEEAEAYTYSAFYSYNYYEGFLWSSDTVYASAQNDTTGYVDYAGTYFIVGQDYVDSTYYVWRGTLFFDTINLPVGAEVNSASVYLYGKADNSTADFDITLVRGAELHTPSITDDYYVLRDETISGGSINTANFTTSDYNEVALTEEGYGGIIRGGVTKFGIRSSEDIGISTPTGEEFVQIWSSESSHPPKLVVNYTVPALGNPDSIEVSGSQVFSGYLTTGDQLYVFRTKVIYGFTPTENSGEYFFVQLLSGSTVVAQVPLADWGYRPGAIYLSPDSALEWGSSVTVRVIGNPDKFVSPSSSSQALTADSWKGSDLDLLDSWVRTSATLIGVYYGEDYLVDIGGTRKLTDSGGALFLTCIPSLGYVRPDIFVSVTYDYPWPDRETSTGGFQSGLLGNLGTSLTNSFNSLGDVFGVSGGFIGSAIWIALMCAVVGFVVVKTGNPTGGVLCSVPFLLIGAYMGMIPMVVLAVAGIVLVGLALHQLWLKGV